MIADNVRNKYGFIVLLLSLVFLLILPPYWSGEQKDTIIGVVVTLSLLSFLSLVIDKRWERLVGIFLAIPILIQHWSPHNDESLSTTFIVSNILFYAFVSFELLRFAVARRKVDTNIICAGVSIYFLFGVLWAYLYMFTELAGPGSIIGWQVDYDGERLQDALYFSFVVQSTLGFGDYTPISDVARSWVILQSMTGQLYLAIVVARLVSLYAASED